MRCFGLLLWSLRCIERGLSGGDWVGSGLMWRTPGAFFGPGYTSLAQFCVHMAAERWVRLRLFWALLMQILVHVGFRFSVVGALRCRWCFVWTILGFMLMLFRTSFGAMWGKYLLSFEWLHVACPLPELPRTAGRRSASNPWGRHPRATFCPTRRSTPSERRTQRGRGSTKGACKGAMPDPHLIHSC